MEVPSWEDRPFDVTFLATFIDYEERQKKWADRYPKDICDAMYGAIEITQSNDDISFVKAFETTFNQCIQQSRDISVFEVNVIDILYELDLYLKGYQRVTLVKAITDAELHIFRPPNQNPSWEKYTKGQNNIIFHDAVPFEKSLDILKQSKIVLNSTVKKQGSQERVFYGLACGALSFTDENTYLKEYFKDGESIAFYRYHELEQVNENINFYLEDELKRKSIARKGREIVMTKHTWDHRMMNLIPQIIPIIEKMKS